MSMFHYIRNLAKAHNGGDGATFRRTLLQIAARQRTQEQREELQRLAANQPTALQLLPQASRDLVRSLDPVPLASLVLAPQVSALLHDVLDEHRSVTELVARGLRPRSRLLFHGTPGNGKTSAAAALAGLLELEGYVVSLPAVVDSYLGATSKNLDKLFAVLAAGCVVVIDELDALGDRRTSGPGAQDRERNLIVSTLLTLLDQAHAGVLVATTNRPDMLDPALRRRFEAEVEFAAPGAAERTTLIRELVLRHRIEDPSGLLAATEKCPSFDAITKAVQAVARREAVAEAKLRPARSTTARAQPFATTSDDG